MATQTTCDLCKVVLTKLGNKHPRLVALCPTPGATAPGLTKVLGVGLDLDVCKACLRRVIGVTRDLFGQKCSPEFIESSAKFLRDTQFDWEDAKVPK